MVFARLATISDTPAIKPAPWQPVASIASSLHKGARQAGSAAPRALTECHASCTLVAIPQLSCPATLGASQVSPWCSPSVSVDASSQRDGDWTGAAQLVLPAFIASL